MKYVNSTSGNPYIAVNTAELCRIAGMRQAQSPDAGLKKRILHQSPDVRDDLTVSAVLDDGGLEYRIDSKADGVCESIGTVYEVTLGKPSSKLTPSQAHTGQLLLNAYIYASSRGLSSVTACEYITDADGTDFVCIKKTYSCEELTGRLVYALKCARPLAENERNRVINVLPSLESLPFPYQSLRPGQKELIETVWTATKQGERLFAQAPTGTGKTVSVLYGTARAMGKADIRRIFYLTAKASTRREAFNAAGMLSKAGAGLRTVVLSAKEQMCPYAGKCSDFLCDEERCPLMRDYREKSSHALKEMLDTYKGYPSVSINSFAAKYGVCPYELSLDLSEYCDIIICDYNYVFDPAVRLRRYFGDDAVNAGKSVFLIDEAHNLTERARDIFSARLTAADVLPLMSFAAEDKTVTDACKGFTAALEGCKKLCADTITKDENGLENGYFFAREQVESLSCTVEFLRSITEKYYYSYKTDRPAAAAASTLLRKLRKWDDASSAYSDKYRTYISVENSVVSASLFCLDPSGGLKIGLDKGFCSVFFSATLTPSDYFADVLGGGKNYMSLSLPSPFPKDNFFVCNVPSVDTRFENRDKSYKRIVYAIAAAAASKPGNYIVFFPSYAYLQPVYEAFTKKYPNVPTACQKKGMKAADRSAFLDFFKDDTGKLRVGFCVLGGSFSEGVDLPGGRLIGTVIVGVGLPGLSAERNMIRDYYDGNAGRGYDYAYTFPGMNSVLQAAGRVIRRDSDRGVVILCDDRYATPAYRALMPPHWDGFRVVEDITQLKNDLQMFWSGKMPEATPKPALPGDNYTVG